MLAFLETFERSVKWEQQARVDAPPPRFTTYVEEFNVRPEEMGLLAPGNGSDFVPWVRCSSSRPEPVICTPTAARGCRREKQPPPKKK